MTIRNPQRRAEILTGLCGIFIYFGGFLAGEIALRALNAYRFGAVETLQGETAPAPKPDESESDTQQGFYERDSLRLPYPNQQLGRIRINNFGFRGPDIAKEKHAAKLRIAFLGSSTTYDADVSEGSTWPEMSVKFLSEQLPECNLEFINAGLPGFATPDMERYWNLVVREFRPDVVIILPGDMTPDLQIAAKEAGFTQGQNSDNSWLSEYSELWALVEKNLQVIRLQRSAFSSEGKFNPDRTAMTEAFSAKIQSIVDTVREDDVFLSVLTITSHVRRGMPPATQLVAADSALYYLPFINIDTLIELQEEYNEVIRHTIKNNPDVLLVGGHDLIPADNRHFVDSRHFAPAGSAKMGQRVADALGNAPAFREFARSHTACTQ